MITFHHVSIACPVCGEVQIIEVKSIVMPLRKGENHGKFNWVLF